MGNKRRRRTRKETAVRVLLDLGEGDAVEMGYVVCEVIYSLELDKISWHEDSEDFFWAIPEPTLT
jgi:hypothetical protein